MVVSNGLMELPGVSWCCHVIVSSGFLFSASDLVCFVTLVCVVLFGVPVLALSFPLVLCWLELCIVDSIGVIVVVIVVVSVVATGCAVGVAVAVDDVRFGVWSGLRRWGPAAATDSSATTVTTAAIVETVGRKVWGEEWLGGCCW